MTAFYWSSRSALASLAILGGTALSIIFLSNPLTSTATAAGKATAKKNFAVQCERLYSDRSVKALAIEETLSYQEICACARTNGALRQKLGAAGISCANNRIVNFNQDVNTSGPGPGPRPEPGPVSDPDPAAKGNNGWGNGAEGVNNGSFTGKTADTKSADNKGTGER